MTVRLIVGRRAEAIAELPRETDKVFFKKVGDAWEIDAFNELSSRK